LAGLDEIVINCTGLGAKGICNDKDLHPMRGQILRCKKMSLPSFVNSTLKGSLSYIIQRSHDSIIGGTDYENDWNEEVDPTDTTLILNRLKALDLEIKNPQIEEVLVGLRPRRRCVRFEFDPEFANVFHNYGHGG